MSGHRCRVAILSVAAMTLVAGLVASAQVREFKPVSDAMLTGVSEPTPIVYNGLMYIPEAAGVVQAFDATTGDLVWT